MRSPDTSDATTTVRVWWAAVRPPAELDLGALSGAERSRVDGLVSTPAAARAATARVLLRAALAETVGGAPADHRLSWDHGPQLAPGDARVWLSLSHTGARVVVALSPAGPVGVDIEPRARAARLTDGLIASITAPGEQQQLAALDDAQRRAAALRLWTAKEAVLKATGEGLQTRPASVEFGGAGEHGTLRLLAHPGCPEPLGHFQVWALTTDPDYVGTLAVLAGDAIPAVREFDGDALLGA